MDHSDQRWRRTAFAATRGGEWYSAAQSPGKESDCIAATKEERSGGLLERRVSRCDLQASAVHRLEEVGRQSDSWWRLVTRTKMLEQTSA